MRPSAYLRLKTFGCVCFVVLAMTGGFAGGQTGADTRPTREQMWFAPTAEDWAKPCLVQFQRTYEDALAVSKATGKPILACVNMDGEIASEHYAGVRYRRPETARLYDAYVNVIASVYRHNPRDFDDQGRRILCPRFGSVTCGEHIEIEAGLYEKFMDGRRIAPRHIGIKPDGTEMYDVYYAFDTDSVFAAIQEGSADFPPSPVVQGDRSILDRVKSRDNSDRSAVEKAFAEGDAALRRSILEAALREGRDVPVEVLRLALSGFDTDLAALARKALAQTGSSAAVELIAEALKSPADTAERENLLAALHRLGETTPRARTLAAVNQGLTTKTGALNVESWDKALGSPSSSAAADDYTVESRLNRQDEVFSSKDADRHVELAESFLAQALKPRSDHEAEFGNVLLLDAGNTAKKAIELGASGWRVHAVLAVTAYYLGQRAEAYRYAETAMKGEPSEAQSYNTMLVIALFAEQRREAISSALRERKTWPSEWMADVHAAYSLLSKHPLANDDQIIAYYDFLRWVGGRGQAGRILDLALGRFPDSGLVHHRLRVRIIEEKGIEALEAWYRAKLELADRPLNTPWYAGYASRLVAEYHRRAGKIDLAIDAYQRSLSHFEMNNQLNSEWKPSADQQIAGILGGLARIELDRRNFEKSVDFLLKSFEILPSAAGELDGLNLSSVDTGKLLATALKEAGLSEMESRVRSAMKQLPADALRAPAFEAEPPGTSRPSRPRRRN